MSLPDIDPAIYQQLAISDLPHTVDLLAGLVTILPPEYRPLLQDRLSIYRAFVASPKFRKIDLSHPWALMLKGWILTDWANQARDIKKQIETGLTGV